MCQASFTKKMGHLGRPLKDLIILENNPIYDGDKDNEILVKDFYDDPFDNELTKMIPLLEDLSKVEDVREVIPTLKRNGKLVRYEISRPPIPITKDIIPDNFTPRD